MYSNGPVLIVVVYMYIHQYHSHSCSCLENNINPGHAVKPAWVMYNTCKKQKRKDWNHKACHDPSSASE